MSSADDPQEGRLAPAGVEAPTASPDRSSRTPGESFDPRSRGMPSGVEAIFSQPAGDRPAILLVAGPRARASGWAATTAAALAERLAGRAQRVVLCDLSVESPELHRLLKTPNLEGMADIFLFGASLKRVVTRAGERGINFVPTGPAVPDAAGILAHHRWDRMLSGAAEAEATLLLYVPAGTRGADALAARAGRAIVLAHPDEAEAVLSGLPEACRHRAVLVPAGARSGRSPAASGEPIADDAIPGFALGEAPAAGGSVFSGRRSRSLAPRILALALALLLLVAGGWLMARILGARTLGIDSGGAEEQGSPRQAAAAAPVPVESPLAYSVSIEAHQDLEVALERAASLEQAHGVSGFFVSPILVDGVLYYRVMAGPLADDSTARAVMRTLVQSGDKREASDWDVRPRPLAFRLGEFASRAPAEARQAALGEAGIPSYIVEVPYSQGPPRFRLYSGAYERAEEAEPLASMLREAGLESPLVERTGLPPA